VPVEGRPGVPPDGASVLTDQFGALVGWGLLGAGALRAAVCGLRARLPMQPGHPETVMATLSGVP